MRRAGGASYTSDAGLGWGDVQKLVQTVVV